MSAPLDRAEVERRMRVHESGKSDSLSVAWAVSVALTCVEESRKSRDMEWWEKVVLVDNVPPTPEAAKMWVAQLMEHHVEEARHAERLRQQAPMECGHAEGNLLTCTETEPSGCVICWWERTELPKKLEEARREGAAEMRERAAMIVLDVGGLWIFQNPIDVKVVAAHIRALPLPADAAAEGKGER